MKTIINASLGLVLALFGILRPAPLVAGHLFIAKSEEPSAAQQLILHMSSGASPAEVLSDVTGIRYHHLGHLDAYLLQLPDGSNVADIASQIAGHPLVRYVESNRFRHTVDDAATDPTSTFETLKTIEAWKMIPDGYFSSVAEAPRRARIAVLDTGIDCGHPDFQNVAGTSSNSEQGGAIDWRASKSFVISETSNLACPWQDDSGHGTQMARSLAAPFRSKRGFPFELLAFKVLDMSGSGTDAEIAEGIAAAADAGADVILLSVSGPGYSQLLQDAITYAWERNCVIVTAAGIDHMAARQFPASANYVVGVATIRGDDLNLDSTRYGSDVNVAAQGNGLLTNIADPTGVLRAGNEPPRQPSLATSGVSTIAALVSLMGRATVANAAIAKRILQSADSFNASGGWEQQIGYGRVNAIKALTGTLRLASVGGIVGQVVDAAGTPVPGVTLNASGISVTTDATGLFRLRQIPAGTRPLTAELDGHAPRGLTVTVAAGTDTWISINMAINLVASAGTVTTNRGSREGIIVQALQHNLVKATTVTNLQGHFTLFLQPGIYDIRASDISLVATTLTGVRIEANSQQDLSLALSEMGRITGMLVDSGGNAIGGAEVIIEGPSGRAAILTDNAGHYSSLGSPAGDYNGTALVPGHGLAVAGGIKLDTDSDTVANLVLSEKGAASEPNDRQVAPEHMATQATNKSRTTPASATSTAGPHVIHVPAGGNLQAAIDQAQPGDEITLQPGAEYRGLFILRNKPGNEYITIRTADLSKIPPAGRRISPAYAAFLPKIASTDVTATIRTDPGAHHYKLVGLEIYTPSLYVYELVRLGSSTVKSVSELASNIELDRVYLHGDPKNGAKRGVTLNSASTSIHECYFSDFKGIGQEAQALAGWNGPGPFNITNNYLEAAGEIILFGGAAPSIQNVIPSDITILRNHFYKQPSWSRFHSSYDGKNWTVKNVIELKMARRVTIEGNVIDYHWAQAQAGYAIVFTVRAVAGAAPWTVIEDVNFVRNIIRHSGCGVNILGKDDNSGGIGVLRRVLIKDNLFEDIDSSHWGGDGRVFQVLSGSQDVTIDHNTVAVSNPKIAMMLDGEPSVRLVYTNNITPHGPSGVFGSGKGTGSAALNYYAPGAVFQKNVLIGASAKEGSYPAGNFFPAGQTEIGFVNYSGGNYRLLNSSPYRNRGTDGKDLGADIDAVTAATQGVTDPDSTSAQAPSADAVSPAQGQGSSQIFRLVVSDPDGSADIKWARLLVNSELGESGGCYLSYEQATKQFSLRSDDGSYWLGPAAAGTTAHLSNGQCTINASSATATTSGNVLTVDVPLEFDRNFAGSKDIYLSAEDKIGLSSGWHLRGAWTTWPDQPPEPESVSPSSGSGQTQSFQAIYSDADGSPDIATTHLLINGELSTVDACYVEYRPADNMVSLHNDDGTGSTPLVLGSSGTISNSQCTLDAGSSFVNRSDTKLTLSFSLRFSPSFYGPKSMYMMAEDQRSLSSKWLTLGMWTPGTNKPPTAVSVTPSAGEGETQTFRAIYADPNYANDLRSAQLLINENLSLIGGCYITYSIRDNSLSLMDDDGGNSSDPVALGQAGSVSNSQCRIDVGASTATSSNEQLILSLVVRLSRSFYGRKTLYLLGVDKNYLDTGWRQAGMWTPAQNAEPAAVSVLPAAGEGTTQSFAATFSDWNGVSDLRSAHLVINNTLSSSEACYVMYYPKERTLWLRDDASVNWKGPVTLGASGTLANGQCSLEAGASTETVNGEQLTLALPLSFTHAFVGVKHVYLLAEDKGRLHSGWQTRGTWKTGQNIAPTADSVTPASGLGVMQNFRLVSSDSNTGGDFRSVHLLLKESFVVAGSCYVMYLTQDNSLWLRDDAGVAWHGPVTPGKGGTLANNQCTLDAAVAAVSIVGERLTVTFPLSFKSTFSGMKNVYALAEDRSREHSGWQTLGTWQPGENQAPKVDSATPSSGEGSTQVFQLVYSDPNGASDIRSAQLLMNERLSASTACYVLYLAQEKTLWLRDDAGANWRGPATLGTAGSLSNNQCTVDAGSSTVKFSGERLTLALPLSFKDGFVGNKNLYLVGEDKSRLNSGWQAKGIWETGKNQPPLVEAVTPASGLGMNRVFQFVSADPNGTSDLRSAHFLVNQSLSATRGCYVLYFAQDNTLWLRDDAGLAWVGPALAGKKGSLENGQCAVDSERSTVTTSGERLTATLPLAFKSSFVGAKSIYVLAEDRKRLNTDWQQAGIWQVGEVNQAPVAVSVTPSSGSCLTQTFQFVYSDPNGSADLRASYALINTTASAASGCLVQYRSTDNSLWLKDNAGMNWTGPGILGTAGILKNSQCMLDVGTATASGSGERLTLGLPLSFASSFSGTKNIYLSAEDTSALSTDWQQRGTWQPESPSVVIDVPAGGNLQNAIDQAPPGATITLQAGATYTGNYILRKKSGDAFVTITTAAPTSLPAPDSRMIPSMAGPLPKIVAPNDSAAIATEDGAHHYRLVGLEVTAKAGVYSYEVISLGSSSATQVSDLSSDIELDRLYIHGDPAVGGKRGVTMNGQSTVVKNCWISGFKSKTQDAQALGGWNGPGPFTIVNNYLEAAGNNLILGGAAAKIIGLVASDVTIRLNHFSKLQSWKGGGWVVRNLLDLKSARRVLIEGNLFENNWAAADPSGFAISLAVKTQKGAMPWAVLEDVSFVRNVVRQSSAAVIIQGKDTGAAGGSSGPTNIVRRILIQDNVIYDIDHVQWGGDGRLFELTAGPENVTIDHNTCLQHQSGKQLIGFDGDPAVAFIFRNNIGNHGLLGVTGVGQATGSQTLDVYAPGSVFGKNAIIGGDVTKYPTNNFFPTALSGIGFVDALNNDYRLTESSQYKKKGTDGKDLGADAEAVRALTQGVSTPGQ